MQQEFMPVFFSGAAMSLPGGLPEGEKRKGDSTLHPLQNRWSFVTVLHRLFLFDGKMAMTPDTPFQIVLVEPEIPPNTGNIARLCAATGTILNLVKPLGFSLDDKHLRRAGLDYWPAVRLRVWDSFDALRKEHPQGRFWLTSKRAERPYVEACFSPGDFLVFGKETEGLPAQLLDKYPEYTLCIPMFTPAVRSLNLSSAAAIVLYEALRQNGRLRSR
jgi:tRNA (cytidine/uridine-2'-O-)-methyltransferase